jgi:hypothetical protein
VENKPQSQTAGNLSVSNPEKRIFLKKVLFTAGLVGIAVGFFLLTLVDPSGQNWAAIVSPFSIIGGYISIIIALLLKV